MSVGVLRPTDLITAAPAAHRHETVTLAEPRGWSPENFAREQIRGLVRQVFFANASHPVRQVVLAAADSGTDAGSVCRGVGEALASETNVGVVVVSRNLPVSQESQKASGQHSSEAVNQPLLQAAIRIRSNLWFAPETKIAASGEDPLTAGSVHSRLWELRREFAYSIVEAPPAGESSEAAALGQLADGIILVLSAHATRRVTACKIKETFEAAQARLLGTVLSDRTFPIPERIYKWL